MTKKTPSLPQHILLATDLSARCDRAQDRAIELAKVWNAKLTVLYVIDVPEGFGFKGPKSNIADLKAAAIAEIRHAFSEVGGISYELEVREGKPADAVLTLANEKNCDLIITGIAGNDRIGRSILGSTTSDLVRYSKAPVLVVKKRAEQMYRRGVVASDLSDASVEALEMGVTLFDPARLAVFYAYDQPFLGFVDNKEAYDKSGLAQAKRETDNFISRCLPRSLSGLSVNVVPGDPALQLAAYVDSENMDLVILGTHGRTGILGVLLGSVAVAILDEVPCDVLVVPSEGARNTV